MISWRQLLRNTSASGHLTFFATFDGAGEYWRLRDSQPHIKPDHDHHRTEQERDSPPPPRQERTAQVRAGGAVPKRKNQQQEHSVGQQESQRCTHLGPHRGPGPLARLRRFGGQQRCTTPLPPTEGEPLGKPQDSQQRRRQQSDLVIGGKQTDRERRDAHHQQ